MPTVININSLNTALFTGAQKYLAGQTVTGDRDGIYHGRLGAIRAQCIKQMVQSSDNLDVTDLYALYLALYNPRPVNKVAGYLKFFGVRINASSRLAGLVANALISGSQTICVGNTFGQVQTSVFSQHAFESARTDCFDLCASTGGAVMAHYNKTKAVRILIDQAIAEMSPIEQQQIRLRAQQFQSQWTHSNGDVELQNRDKHLKCA